MPKEERQPSEENLAKSKRQPQRDRSAPPRNSENKTAIRKVDEKSKVTVIQTTENKTGQAQASSTKREQDTAEPRERASNDPRHRGAKASPSANDNSEPKEELDASTVEMPEISNTKKAVDAAENTVEPANARLNSLAENSAIDKVVTEVPESGAEIETPKIAAVESPNAVTEEALLAPNEILSPPSDAIVKGDKEVTVDEPETTTPTRAPGRASNDPREVKRRGRENALRKQGVLIQPQSNNSQESSDGSSSS